MFIMSSTFFQVLAMKFSRFYNRFEVLSICILDVSITSQQLIKFMFDCSYMIAHYEHIVNRLFCTSVKTILAMT